MAVLLEAMQEVELLKDVAASAAPRSKPAEKRRARGGPRLRSSMLVIAVVSLALLRVRFVPAHGAAPVRPAGLSYEEETVFLRQSSSLPPKLQSILEHRRPLQSIQSITELHNSAVLLEGQALRSIIDAGLAAAGAAVPASAAAATVADAAHAMLTTRKQLLAGRLQFERRLSVRGRGLLLGVFLPEAGSAADSAGQYQEMADWYESVLRLGLPAVVLHTDLSPSIAALYSTSRIQFVRVGQRRWAPRRVAGDGAAGAAAGDGAALDPAALVLAWLHSNDVDVQYLVVSDVRRTMFGSDPLAVWQSPEDTRLFLPTWERTLQYKERYAACYGAPPPPDTARGAYGAELVAGPAADVARLLLAVHRSLREADASVPGGCWREAVNRAVHGDAAAVAATAEQAAAAAAGDAGESRINGGTQAWEVEAYGAPLLGLWRDCQGAESLCAPAVFLLAADE